jgi:arylformamidase
MDLSHYYGPCRVVSAAPNSLIEAKALEGKLTGVERVVLHGGGDSFLTRDAALLLIDAGVKTIVTDSLSISPRDMELELHTLLLSHGVAIVENVLLDGVEDGDYLLCAFPIKYGGLDGAPVRAVLIR